MKRKRGQDPKLVELYERFHWGDAPARTSAARAPEVTRGETLYLLGDLVEVVYETTKAGELFEWQHEFKRPRPRLAATRSGGLIILGGGYSVSDRGIVG